MCTQSARGHSGSTEIVARLNSQEDKERILQTKKVLGKSRVYSQVTIRPDQSPEQGALDRKLCMVAGAMGMEYRGGRYRYSGQNREEGGGDRDPTALTVNITANTTR